MSHVEEAKACDEAIWKKARGNLSNASLVKINALV
jgi:hypothetical protein